MSAKNEAKRQAFLKKLRKEMNEILRKPEREIKEVKTRGQGKK